AGGGGRLGPGVFGCRRGGRQGGCFAAIRLSGAVWTEGPAVRQGHRLLSLLPSRLCRAQKLAAADARVELSRRRGGLLGARRNRIRRAAPVDLGRGHRPRLGPAGALFRGEGLVLWSRPLSAALGRQWGGGRGELQ